MLHHQTADPGRAARHRGRLAFASAVLLLAGALAACGATPAGSGVATLQSPATSADPSASAGPSQDPKDAMLAYAKCMREHGVNLQVSSDGNGLSGTITGNGGSGSGPALSSAVPLAPSSGAPSSQAPAGNVTGQDPARDADTACRSLLPAAGVGAPHAPPAPAVVDQMLAFAKCMRDHGVDYPDPKFDGGAISIQIGGPGSNVDPSSQAFQDAQKACGSTLPGGGPMTVDGGTSTGISIGGTITGTNP